VEEKNSSSLFTKIYYKDIEENDYNLLSKDFSQNNISSDIKK